MALIRDIKIDMITRNIVTKDLTEPERSFVLQTVNPVYECFTPNPVSGLFLSADNIGHDPVNWTTVTDEVIRANMRSIKKDVDFMLYRDKSKLRNDKLGTFLIFVLVGPILAADEACW